MANTLTAPAWVRSMWPTPNYVDPVTQGPALEIICITLSGVGLVIVALRLFSRAYITKLLGLDDILMILALGLCIALSVLLIVGMKTWYLGYHIWDLPALSVVAHRHGIWITSYLYVFAAGCIKISVLLFYRRLNIVFSNAFLIATYIGIAYNVCYVVGFVLGNTLLCNPIQAFWLRYDLQWRESHQWSCGNEGLSLPMNGAFSVIGDLYSTIIPLILVTSLDLPRRQKIALYALFGLGFLVVGAGIARTVFLSFTVLRTYDFTWEVYDVWIWSIVELYVAIFTASAPALKPLLGRMFGREFLGYSYSSSKRSRPTMSEINDRDTEAGNRSDGHTGYESTDNEKQITYKKSQDLESAMSEEENRHIIRHVASAGLHGSISDALSFDHELDGMEHGHLGNARHIGKVEPAIGHAIEEEDRQSCVSSVEVDPPVYPPNFKRHDQTLKHKRSGSNSTIGTAITTNDAVEYNPRPHTQGNSQGGHVSPWMSPNIRPASAGANHPQMAQKVSTRRSIDDVRRSRTPENSHHGHSEQVRSFSRPRLPLYDAEFSQWNEPVQAQYSKPKSITDSDKKSCHSSEADEKRQDAILVAAQQSRLSIQRRPHTGASSISDSSWELPFHYGLKRKY